MSLKPLPQNLMAPLQAPNAGNPLRAPTPQAASLPGLIGNASGPSGDGAPTEFSRLLERQRQKSPATPARAPTAAVSTAPSSSPMRPPTNPPAARGEPGHPASTPGTTDKEAHATQPQAVRARAANAQGKAHAHANGHAKSAERAPADQDRVDATERSASDVGAMRGAAEAKDMQGAGQPGPKAEAARPDDSTALMNVAATAPGVLPGATAEAAAASEADLETIAGGASMNGESRGAVRGELPGAWRPMPDGGVASAVAEDTAASARQTEALRDGTALSDALMANGPSTPDATAATVDGRQVDASHAQSREDRRVAEVESGALRAAALDPAAGGDRAMEGSIWLEQAVRQGLNEAAPTAPTRHGAVTLDGATAIGAPATGNALVGTTSTEGAVPLAPYVSTPLDDPGFREALGAQVSLLARDGVHTAELRLNPADMGPVSVQITMNGDQATVDFGADRAQTRQAIEAGWAELAASLRESGFTLSGGGVSSRHARDRADDGDDRAGRTRGVRIGDSTAEDTASASQAVLRSRPLAGAALDLYA